MRSSAVDSSSTRRTTRSASRGWPRLWAAQVVALEPAADRVDVVRHGLRLEAHAVVHPGGVHGDPRVGGKFGAQRQQQPACGVVIAALAQRNRLRQAFVLGGRGHRWMMPPQVASECMRRIAVRYPTSFRRRSTLSANEAIRFWISSSIKRARSWIF